MFSLNSRLLLSIVSASFITTFTAKADSITNSNNGEKVGRFLQREVLPGKVRRAASEMNRLGREEADGAGRRCRSGVFACCLVAADRELEPLEEPRVEQSELLQYFENAEVAVGEMQQ